MQKQNEVAFNIGLKESEFVAESYIKLFRLYRDGDLEGWFWGINVLRELINAHFLKDSSDNLDTQEELCKSKLKVWKNSKYKKEYLLKKNEFGDEVKKYMRLVLKGMKKLGYLPSKRDRTKLSF